MKTIVICGVVSVGLLALGCESGDSNKSWSEFSRCMLGDGVTKPSEVAGRIRTAEMVERKPPAQWDAKQGWPGRCEPYANALYSSLGSGTEHKLLKRALTAQMSCKEGEDTPGCTFAPGGPILPGAAELWEAAAIAKLELTPNVEVPTPKHDVTLQNPADWKTLAREGYETGDAFITPSGKLRLLLKSRGGPLTTCDVAGATAKCAAVSAEVPQLALQSVKLLRDEEAIVSGLTTDGRQAFFAQSGEAVGFRGMTDAAARDGLVIEEGEDGSGFLAIVMAKGKPKGEAAITPELVEKEAPVSVDSFASWTKGKAAEMQWQFTSVRGRELKQAASFSGDFSGFLHPCASTEGSSVGIWGRSSGEREGKPTAGGDTAIHASFLANGEWSKPVSSKMPFRRSLTAQRCGPNQLEVFWAGAEGETLEIGKVSCAPGGCKVASSKWPSFSVRRWLAAGPVGDKFFALWTTELGETRIRVGDPDNFAAATESVVFESAERGGPVFRDAQTYYTPKGAYLLVHDAGPTLLHIEPSGSITSLAAM